MSPQKGSGIGWRTITSNQVQQHWLKVHMAKLAAMRPQNRRVWPRLSRAFRVERIKVTVSVKRGTRSPMATRKFGLGKTNGANAKARSRPMPQASNEMGRKDTASYHMVFQYRVEMTPELPAVT